MVELNTTTVSMILPDLLFLNDFFLKRKKVNVIPRWYQVYQEEFDGRRSPPVRMPQPPDARP